MENYLRFQHLLLFGELSNQGGGMDYCVGRLLSRIISSRQKLLYDDILRMSHIAHPAHTKIIVLSSFRLFIVFFRETAPPNHQVS